jgi:hypothetical protein
LADSSDKAEKVIRFGCGFVFGLIVGVSSLILFLVGNDSSWLASALVVALIFGALSMRYGDPFWRWLSRLSLWGWWS